MRNVFIVVSNNINNATYQLNDSNIKAIFISIHLPMAFVNQACVMNRNLFIWF